MPFRLLFFLLVSYSNLVAQDSLFLEVIKKHSYYFTIDQDTFSGDGASFLDSEFSKSQFVLIGEYHESPQISEFTLATIKNLAAKNFKTIGLEMGKHGVAYLDQKITQEPGKSVRNTLVKFHNDYYYTDDEDYRYTSIPFVDNESDAVFYQALIDSKWDILGLDQEFTDGFIPLVDYAAALIETNEIQDFELDMETLKDSIYSYQLQSLKKGRLFWDGLESDQLFQQFLNQAKDYESLKALSDDIENSIEIYTLAQLKYQYYSAFRTRLKHFKQNLKTEWQRVSFDLNKDKMLLKFGGLHTGRGTSSYECQDIGTTLSEIADFNGNESLHLIFNARYYKEAGKIIDDGASEKEPLIELIRQGKKDQWTLIDLRPLREKGLFYPFLYELTKDYEQLIINHDIFVITPLDYEDAKLFD